MEEWKTYKIGEISEVNKSQYSPKENWQNFLYLDTGSITRNQIDSIQTISLATELPSRARRKVVNFDIVYSTVRPNQCHYGILKNPKTNLLVSTGFAVITVNQEVANPLFVYYYLTQDYIIDALQAIAEQSVSAYPSIKPSDIENVEVYLPPLNIQNTIANILSCLDSKIELNNRINHNLEEQAQALYKSWFVDFEPFKDGKFVESELGMIPEGWRVVTMGEVTTEIRTKVGNRTGIKVLSPINTGKLALSEEYFTKQVFSNSIAKYILVKPKSFAYNPARVNIGSIGMNEFPFDGCVSPVYVVFRCEDEYEYLFDFFRKGERFKTEVITRSIGGVRQTLAYKDFSMIKMVYPPAHIIRDFNSIYLTLYRKINDLDDQNKKISEIRDTILPKLMSGELKINEIDC